tara:strand:+ start:1544 stop:2158 length:615 start_codon:yes stop_codon:yes gene_type:complete
MNHAFAKYRLLLSKLLLIVIIIVLIISENNINSDSLLYNNLELVGLLLLLIGVFGRIWSSLYIEGNKTNNLITGGIYSLSRNPLYFFSFLLLLSYCLVIKSLVVVGLSSLFWVLIYPRTIKHEEQKLLKIHGDKYLEYYNKTPKIIPNFFLFQKNDKKCKIDITIRNIERVLVESFGFILFYEIIRFLNYLHYSDILPSFFIIY